MAAVNTTLNIIKMALKENEDIKNIMADEAVLGLFIAELISMYSTVFDSRVQGMCDFAAGEVLTAVQIGVLCGKNNWVELDLFMKNREAWCFEHFPSMKEAGRTPSHDTLNRIFSKLDYEQLQIVNTTFIQEHINEIMGRLGCAKPEQKVVPIDGKVERGTGRKYNAKAGGEVRDMQTLHAYDASTGMAILSRPIEEKTNEIPTARQFFEELDSAEGIIFTGDAMHAQKVASSIITSKGGDYCFGTKGNQKQLLQDAMDLFTPEVRAELKANGSYRITTEKAHGCIEVREYFIAEMAKYPGIKLDGWTNLKSITLCSKTSKPLFGGEPSKEDRYYIASITDPDLLPKVIRGHWSVESVFHETLDKVFLCDANTTMNWDAVTNLFSIYKVSLPMINLVEPMVLGNGVKNVRQCINDDFSNSLGKLSWLFAPHVFGKIKSIICEKFARLEMLRKEREMKKKEAKSA